MMDWIIYIGGGLAVLALVAWLTLRKSKDCKDDDIYPLW